MARSLRRVAWSFVVGAAVSHWVDAYRVYRRNGRAQTAHELEQLRAVETQTFSRHYHERVPTIEEEFTWWGPYHQHRHEMRYDLVAEAVRCHLPPGGRVLDVGAGAGLVADRMADIDGRYDALEFSERNVRLGPKKFAGRRQPLVVRFVQGDAERLPYRDERFDVVVMSEVIEHLLHPDRAVWEVARVLRPGGVFVMTTNNASEVPCVSPVKNPLAWVEKAVAATRPELMSLRPWVWPYPVDADLLPPGSPDVHLPHTHHIYEETRRLFGAAGLETFQWSSFEFPPPQSATAAWLDRRGALGREAVDVLEAVCRRLPLVKRMGCHLFMQARKAGPPIAPQPPPSLWPGSAS